MPFKITEFTDSRKFMFGKDTETSERIYVGYGTSNEVTAYAEFTANIPLTVPGNTGNLARLSFNIVTMGGLFWRANAFYGPDPATGLPGVGGAIVQPIPGTVVIPGDTTPLDASYAIDFSGVTEHITQSKETTYSTLGAPNTNRAIGITADGQVQGTERISPNYEWKKSVTFEYVTMGYLKMLSGMVGSTNNATFYSWPAQSNVFLGGQADIRDNLRAVVTFKFLARPNITETINLSPDISIPGKKGSEYVWVSYINHRDANKLTQKPNAAYVERICDLKDWGNFRIGS